MVEQLLSNTNEMLQCILALQNLDLNTALALLDVTGAILRLRLVGKIFGEM
jgi:hypothetical protein